MPTSWASSLLRASSSSRSLSGASSYDFHGIADRTLETYEELLIAVVEDDDDDTLDVQYDSGVLELKLGSKGTYVINKQAPNEQLWLSSPVTGPFRYDYSVADEQWYYARDNHRLHAKLSEEISKLLGREVPFPSTYT